MVETSSEEGWLLAALTAAAQHFHTERDADAYLQVPVRGTTMRYDRFTATFPDPGCPVYRALLVTCWAVPPDSVHEHDGGLWPPPRTHAGRIPGTDAHLHPAAVPELPAGRIRRSGSSSRDGALVPGAAEFRVPRIEDWNAVSSELSLPDAIRVMSTYHVIASDAGPDLRDTSRQVLEAAILLETR